MISHKYNCIFIHIPKAAGSSIAQKLGYYDGGNKTKPDHRTIRHLTPLTLPNLVKMIESGNARLLLRCLRNKLQGKKTVTDEQYSTYFKFAFVRNPWSRVHSYYRNLMRGGRLINTWGVPKHISFDVFVKKYCNQRALNPQTFWITGFDGKIGVDFVGKFEHLEQDFSYICDVLDITDKNLPMRNTNAEPANYITAYNSETQEIIARKYAEEIELFKYTFAGKG